MSTMYTYFMIPCFLLCGLLVPSNATSYSYRWAATGGGLRAMTANMGLANLVKQVGLLDDTEMIFDAISTSSGATWFSTQFFYSPQFFNKVIGTPNELFEFVVTWINAYASVASSDIQDPVCNLVGYMNMTLLEDLRSACTVLVEHDGNWASFVAAALNATSTSYGDVDFVTRHTDGPNKIESLKDTVLLIQTSLAPLYRNRSSNTAIYISPADSDSPYSVPLSTQYMVTHNERLFVSAADAALDTTTAASITTNFSFGSFKHLGLFPESNGSVLLTSMNLSADEHRVGEFAMPFGGTAPTTAQITAASSAAFGVFSGLVPSLFAQVFWHEHKQLEEEGDMEVELASLGNAAQILYQTPVFDGLAVCSQYPQPCSDNDGMFVDGSFTDGPTLALSIGEYQSLEKADLTTTLKILLMNSNSVNDTFQNEVSLLGYFRTSFNSGIDPGDYIWAPGSNTPWRSPQIFEEAMDSDKFHSLLSPIDGSDLSTLNFSGTTTSNPAFGIIAGQKVEVLMILVNTDIPELIVGAERIEKYTVPLAELAQGIAENEELMARVREFFPILTKESFTMETSSAGRGYLSGVLRLLLVAVGTTALLEF